jgi:hypothetical protein
MKGGLILLERGRTADVCNGLIGRALGGNDAEGRNGRQRCDDEVGARVGTAHAHELLRNFIGVSRDDARATEVEYGVFGWLRVAGVSNSE